MWLLWEKLVELPNLHGYFLRRTMIHHICWWTIFTCACLMSYYLALWWYCIWCTNSYYTYFLLTHISCFHSLPFPLSPATTKLLPSCQLSPFLWLPRLGSLQPFYTSSSFVYHVIATLSTSFIALYQLYIPSCSTPSWLPWLATLRGLPRTPSHSLWISNTVRLLCHHHSTTAVYLY